MVRKSFIRILPLRSPPTLTLAHSQGVLDDIGPKDHHVVLEALAEQHPCVLHKTLGEDPKPCGSRRKGWGHAAVMRGMHKLRSYISRLLSKSSDHLAG